MKAKNLIAVFFFLISCYTFGQGTQNDQTETLTNEAIKSMVSSKISKKIIQSKIQSTDNSFDLSSVAIIELSRNGIGDDLILSMFDAVKTQPKSTEILTNEMVMNMVGAKISKKIIFMKIQTSNNNFDLKSDALIKLSNNKVSEDIVMAMMDTKNKKTEIAKPEVKIQTKKYNKPTDLSQINQPGIYYFDGNTNNFIKLDPNVFSQSKVSGGLLNSVVSSMFKVKAKASLNGSTANFQFTDSDISFYFYFSNSATDGKKMDQDLFESAESPNEFTLAKFKTYQNKNIREIELGSSNAEGAAYGVNNVQVVSFKYEKINENIYRIYFQKPLGNGEYCFMPSINSATQGNSSKMYDFGVSVE